MNRLLNLVRTTIKSSIRPSIRPYHSNVLDHYNNPRNVGSMDKKKKSVGTGLVGAPACGDVMQLQIDVDDNGQIIDAKFKTFGCGSAIASSSLATEFILRNPKELLQNPVRIPPLDEFLFGFERIINKSITEAHQLTNKDIASELRLPPVKLHCSMLAEDAIKAAILDFTSKNPDSTPDSNPDVVCCGSGCVHCIETID